MNLLLLLDMAASGGDSTVAAQAGTDRMARRAAAPGLGRRIGPGRASTLAFVGTNGLAFPVGLFAAAAAGVPFAPLNYRLGADQLHENLSRLDDPVVVAGVRSGPRSRRGATVSSTSARCSARRRPAPRWGGVRRRR
ncbi:MAG: hypothetical protein WKF43_02025 [Acidimicrobiales bacterium]